MSTGIVIAVILGLAGLSFVYFKNQLHATGAQIKALERELADLKIKNEVAQTRISSFSSRAALQRRLDEGFIKMIPIANDRIVRVSTAAVNIAGSADEIRAVANPGTIK